MPAEMPNLTTSGSNYEVVVFTPVVNKTPSKDR